MILKDELKVILAVALFSVVFTSSAFASTINLPQTGQTTCYDEYGGETSCAGTGQDGEFQAGVIWPSQRFTESGDCVTDNLTGLMWVKNSGTILKSWQESLAYAGNLDLCGYADWRLPDTNELLSISNNAAAWLNNQGFSNVQQSYGYWTSSTFMHNTAFAWYVSINGPMNAWVKTQSVNYAWPVRGTTSPYSGIQQTGQTACYDEYGGTISCAGTGQDGELQAGVAWPGERFTVSGDCVTDTLTGLTWVKNPDSTRFSWQGSLDHAHNLNLCGYTDWRLPNLKEMQSLANYGESDATAWLNSQGFSNVQDSAYWSSTNLAETPAAWAVSPYGYYVSFIKDHPVERGPAWPVRGGTVSDLAVSVLSAPDTAAPGSSVSIADTTANSGSGASGSSTTQFYLSVDSLLDGSDTLLGSRSVSELSAGSSSSGTTLVTIPSDAAGGTNYIIAEADGLDEVSEKDEFNNTTARAISISTSNQPPMCSHTAPVISCTGRNVSFTDASWDDDFGGPAVVRVNWGDTHITYHQIGDFISYTYANDSTNTVRHEVQDATGAIHRCDPFSVTVPQRYTVTVSFEPATPYATIKVLLDGVIKAQGSSGAAGVSWISGSLLGNAGYTLSVTKTGKTFSCHGQTVDLSCGNATVSCIVQ